MTVVFAAIAPHGGMLVSEDERHVAPATVAAMEELGRRWEAARPEATIVFTPHNVHVEGHFAVATASSAAGSLADWEAPDVTLELPLDRELALAVVDALRAEGLPAVGVS